MIIPVGLCYSWTMQLKYLQNEYKKHKVHMNVKDKNLLHYWILPTN